MNRSPTHESGRLSQPQFRAIKRQQAGKTWKDLLTLQAERYIIWAGSFYNGIMRGNSAGTVWFRLPSLCKCSNLDIGVIGWLSESRDLGGGVVSMAQVSGFSRRRMNESSVIVMCAGPRGWSSKQKQQSDLRDKMKILTSYTGWSCYNTSKQKQRVHRHFTHVHLFLLKPPEDFTALYLNSDFTSQISKYQCLFMIYGRKRNHQ